VLEFLCRSKFFYQYGFLPYQSVQDAVFDLVCEMQTTLDSNKVALGLFIDLKKAFDTVDHQILSERLDSAGIRGIPLLWFQNYLSNRKQFVFVNSVCSETSTISCGIPQGSILGPLLFLSISTIQVFCLSEVTPSLSLMILVFSIRVQIMRKS